MARDIEADEDVEDINLVEEDDETEAIIRKALKDMGGDDDADVFSGPLKEKDVATVSVEDGLDLIDKAAGKKGMQAKADSIDAPDETAPAPEAKAAEVEKPAEAAAPADADLDALLTGIDGDRRTALVGRITAADEVMGLFKGRDAELQMHGTTPKDAMARLIQINTYATQNPDEYLAWAATQLAPEKAEDILSKAAERLGLKIVKAEEAADDPFEDEGIKALREENRRLKAQVSSPPEFGPDTEQRRVQDDLTRFRTETAPDGKLKRPLFDRLQQDIAARAGEQVKATGKPITLTDLDRFYTEAEGEMRAALGIPASPAAQAPAPVQQVDNTKAAADARLERAKAASKSIDGTGQGASRRPALKDSASIDEVIRYHAGLAD